MQTKENVLEITDKMDTLLETSINGLTKTHTLSAEAVVRNLKQLRSDLERVTALVKREPAN